MIEAVMAKTQVAQALPPTEEKKLKQMHTEKHRCQIGKWFLGYSLILKPTCIPSFRLCTQMRCTHFLMIHSPWLKLVHSFRCYVWITSHVPSTVTGTEDIAKNKINEVYILVGIYN